MTLSVVTAFLGPAPGEAFARAEWPAHVTVSTNFVSPRPAEELAASVEAMVRATDPLVAVPGARAAFGAAGEIPVVLVEPEHAWRELHLDVVRALGEAGCSFTTPFTGTAYRAHVTDTSAGSWSHDVRITVLHLIELDGGTARVVAPIRLGAGPA